MNRTTRLAASLGLFALASITAVAASAHPRDAGFQHRQQNQAQRIAQGVASGSLTWQEARRLGAEQRAIHAQQQRFLADGVLTPGERARLHQARDRASRHIWREKHDGQRRF